MALEIHPFAGPTGAEICGIDVGSLCAPDFSRIYDAFLQRGFVVFRDQTITPDQHVRFSERFGPLKGHVLKQYLLPESEFILVLSNKEQNGKPLGLVDAGRYWHSDVSYEDIPPLGSMLYGIEVPPIGGDTLFANQYSAYDLMPSALKARVQNLRARHRFNYAKLANEPGSSRQKLTAEQERQLVGAVHPIIRVHPETGRKALYVNPGFTVAVEGVDAQESESLLQELFGYATSLDVIARHLWKPRDLLLWDNRCLMHHATTYPSQYIRHMHRTTISGSRPQ